MKHSCIITGATGYIGSHLVKYLLEQGWEVRIISQPEFGYANIEDVKDKIHIFEYDHDINSLINYFRSVNAEVVFHLAAAVITDYKPEQVSILIQSNIQFGTEILEAMKYSSTRLFVSTGSYWQNYNSDIYMRQPKRHLRKYFNIMSMLICFVLSLYVYLTYMAKMTNVRSY